MNKKTTLNLHMLPMRGSFQTGRHTQTESKGVKKKVMKMEMKNKNKNKVVWNTYTRQNRL